MSRTWGMFSRMTGWSVSRAAAMQGSAAFFAPLTRTVPRSGSPPRITNLTMDGSLQGYCSGDVAAELLLGLARVRVARIKNTINHTGQGGHRGKPQLLAKNARNGAPGYSCSLYFCQFDGLADVAFCFFQGGGGLGFVYACGQHYYGHGSSVAGGFQSAGGCVVIGSGGLFNDADGAL